MAPKAFPALVLLVLVCGQTVVDGHAQPYIGGTRGGSPAGMRSPTYTTTHGPSSTIGGYDGTGGRSGVEEEKAFMVNGLPAHDRPLPVPPSGH